MNGYPSRKYPIPQQRNRMVMPFLGNPQPDKRSEHLVNKQNGLFIKIHFFKDCALNILFGLNRRNLPCLETGNVQAFSFDGGDSPFLVTGKCAFTISC